ncbi:MAG: hypothetical protein F6K24_18570 [Okeania sp. SIO2D1]|nr:hypothetical protein [Okeania sp. SIO2D1]
MGRWRDGGMGGWGDGEMGRWGLTPNPTHPRPSQEGKMGKYLVIVEDGTFFYTELNGFDMK